MTRFRLVLSVDVNVYPTLGPGEWQADAEVLRLGDTDPDAALTPVAESALLLSAERAIRFYRERGLEPSE